MPNNFLGGKPATDIEHCKNIPWSCGAEELLTAPSYNVYTYAICKTHTYLFIRILFIYVRLVDVCVSDRRAMGRVGEVCDISRRLVHIHHNCDGISQTACGGMGSLVLIS